MGLGLAGRGHRITVATGESQRKVVEQHGLHFVPVRPDRTIVTEDPQASKQAAQLRTGSAFAVKNLLRYVEETYSDLVNACQGCDLFISHPAAFCAPLVVEKLGLPWLSLALAPATLFSAMDPPILPSAPWLAGIPQVGGFPHSLIFRAFKKLTRNWMEPIDRLRLSIGLKASTKHPFFEGMFSPYGTLGLFSRELAAPQKDWPANTRITGFPFCAQIDEGPLEADLEKFLSAGPAPVVFTLGSNVVREAGGFYRESLEAAKHAGCRAVLLTGGGARNRLSEPSSDLIFSCAYAPYKMLFPRAAAVVHHGGIGTLGHAMAAGAPMLIVPHVHDQPDNAHRASKLGIARSQSRAGYKSGSVAAHLKILLTDPAYQISSKAVQSRMLKEEGGASACDVIEEVLARA